MTDRLIIWQFWENAPGSTMPDYLALCREIVVRNCPRCDVRLVTPDNIGMFAPDFPKDIVLRLPGSNTPAIALKADYLRACLLYHHGGLWLDLDCIVHQDLDAIVRERLARAEFVCIEKTVEQEPYVPNNFIASRPGGSIIGEYLRKIEEKLATSRDHVFSWAEIGQKLLTPIVFAHREKASFLPEAAIHPVHYKDHEIFERPSVLVAGSVAGRYRADDDASEPGAPGSGGATVPVVTMLYNNLFSDRLKGLPRDFLLVEPTFLGELFRRELGTYAAGDPPGAAAPADGASRAFDMGDIVVVFTTVHRPQSCEALLRSVRAHWPDVAITFAAQHDATDAEAETYTALARTYGARVIFVGADAGLSRARNELVAATSEPVIFLMDDDFVVTGQTNLAKALAIFNADPDLFVLGGAFDNFDYGADGEVTGRRYSAFDYDILPFPSLGDGIKVMMPKAYVDVDRRFVDPVHYYQPADSVNNFCLMDRRLFHEHGIRWSDEIRIMGEHEDFYFAVKARSVAIGIAHTNALIVQHHRRTNADFAPMRNRMDGFVAMMRKWKLDRIIFPGKRIDSIDHGGTVSRTWNPAWRSQRSDD